MKGRFPKFYKIPKHLPVQFVLPRRQFFHEESSNTTYAHYNCHCDIFVELYTIVESTTSLSRSSKFGNIHSTKTLQDAWNQGIIQERHTLLLVYDFRKKIN